MKYISYYIVITESYDYFGGHKRKYNKFDTLIEAWNFFKSELKYVYHYDDGSFSSVEKPFIVWDWEKPKHTYHNVRWMKKAIATPLYEDIFNIDDEDILI